MGNALARLTAQMQRSNNVLNKDVSLAANLADIGFGDDGLALYKGEPLFKEMQLRPYQKLAYDVIYTREKRRLFLVWSRRSGKDSFCWYLLVSMALKRKGRYFYVGHTLADIRSIIVDGMFHGEKESMLFVDMLPPGVISNVRLSSPIIVTFINGSTIEFRQALEYNKLRGVAISGVVITEFAFYATPEIITVVSPAIATIKGFMLINTTYNGKNFAYDLFMSYIDKDQWYTDIRPADKLLSPKGDRYITEAMIQECRDDGFSEEKINEEFFCIPRTDGEMFYFAVELEELREDGRLRTDTLIADTPMHFSLDLGMRDDTVIVGWQFNIQGQVVISYEYKANNQPYSHYVNTILDYARAKGIRTGTIVLPHDSKQRHGTNSTVTTALDDFRKEYANCVPLKKPVNKESLIDLTKGQFKNLIINEKCTHILKCLHEYRRDYNEITKLHKEVHNFASHGADAVKYAIYYIALTKDDRIYRPAQKRRQVCY